jgi:hypothetical protein
MNATRAALVMLVALASPALAQQNQTPGYTDDAGSQRESSPQDKVQHALAGANTTDGTTTGVSGPKSKSGGPPGNTALPDLPTQKLCDSAPQEARQSCLSTVLNKASEPATGVQQ